MSELLNNAIKHAKSNLCNVYIYDGYYSDHRYLCPLGIVEYHKDYLEVWFNGIQGNRIQI